MEIIVHLIGALVRGLDHLSQKSLDRVVRDLEPILVDPAEYFRYQELHIGPWRRWGSGMSLGLLLWIALFFLNLALDDVIPADPAKQFRYAALLLVMPIVCLMVGMYWLRGGACILDASGVRFVHRGIEVFCPWSLFSAPGKAIVYMQRGRNRIELPIAADAVPLVEARRNDCILAQGMTIKTRQLRFRSPHEALLKNLYRVKPDELAWLLLHLGRTLGSSAAAVQTPSVPRHDSYAEKEPAAEMPSSQHAVTDADGWIIVRLTRLGFPPLCCNCGEGTTHTQPFRAYTPFLRLGRFFSIEGNEHLRIEVPVCPTCRRRNRRRFLRTFGKAFLIVEGIAAGGAFLIGTIVAVANGDPKMFPSLPIGLAFMAGFLGLLFAWFIGKWAGRRASAPVELQRYLPEEGTVSLRFRRPEYVQQMLHNL